MGAASPASATTFGVLQCYYAHTGLHGRRIYGILRRMPRIALIQQEAVADPAENKRRQMLAIREAAAGGTYGAYPNSSNYDGARN